MVGLLRFVLHRAGHHRPSTPHHQVRLPGLRHLQRNEGRLEQLADTSKGSGKGGEPKHMVGFPRLGLRFNSITSTLSPSNQVDTRETTEGRALSLSSIAEVDIAGDRGAGADTGMVRLVKVDEPTKVNVAQFNEPFPPHPPEVLINEEESMQETDHAKMKKKRKLRELGQDRRHREPDEGIRGDQRRPEGWEKKDKEKKRRKDIPTLPESGDDQDHHAEEKRSCTPSRNLPVQEQRQVG